MRRAWAVFFALCFLATAVMVSGESEVEELSIGRRGKASTIRRAMFTMGSFMTPPGTFQGNFEEMGEEEQLGEAKTTATKTTAKAEHPAAPLGEAAASIASFGQRRRRRRRRQHRHRRHRHRRHRHRRHTGTKVVTVRVTGPKDLVKNVRGAACELWRKRGKCHLRFVKKQCYKVCNTKRRAKSPAPKRATTNTDGTCQEREKRTFRKYCRDAPANCPGIKVPTETGDVISSTYTQCASQKGATKSLCDFMVPMFKQFSDNLINPRWGTKKDVVKRIIKDGQASYDNVKVYRQAKKGSSDKNNCPPTQVLEFDAADGQKKGSTILISKYPDLCVRTDDPCEHVVKKAGWGGVSNGGKYTVFFNAKITGTSDEKHWVTLKQELGCWTMSTSTSVIAKAHASICAGKCRNDKSKQCLQQCQALAEKGNNRLGADMCFYYNKKAACELMTVKEGCDKSLTTGGGLGFTVL